MCRVQFTEERSDGVVVGVDDTGIEVVVEDDEESGEDERDLERKRRDQEPSREGTMRSNFRTNATVHSMSLKYLLGIRDPDVS